MKRVPYTRIALIWILFLVVSTAALLWIDIPVAKPGDVAGFLAYTDRLVHRYMERRSIPGVAVGLVHDGQVAHLAGYGYADVEQSIPVTEATVFQAASVSKSLTAWGIMRLVQEGRLGLDDPVSKHLTRWELPPSEFGATGVTIRRLLSHSAGIANVGGYGGFGPGEELQTLESSLDAARDANGESTRIIYSPGNKYHYSGGGYTLLQLVIEEVTHLPFETYMETAVLAPLNMGHSSFVLSPTLEKGLSAVYDSDGKAAPSRAFTAKAAAGLYTTAQDLSSWVAAMMPSDTAPQGRGVLQPETLEVMFRLQPDLSKLLPYGLGYMVQQTGSGDLEVSHTGKNLPGWHSLVAAVPAKGEGLVLLTNSSGGAALRQRLRCAWLHWATGSSTFALRLDRLVSILLVVLPVGGLGLLVLFVASRLRISHRVTVPDLGEQF